MPVHGTLDPFPKAERMSFHDKIQEMDALAERLERMRAEGKRIILSHGVFDLLHMGHIRHLEQAKHMGDVLVVTLTQDRHVNKGPHRPAFPQDLRAEAIAALGVVDYVAVNRWPTAEETIALLRPHVFVKGQDYKVAEEDVTGGIAREAAAVHAVGGEIRFTEEITFSSSKLLNTYFSPFSEETETYLQNFRRAHPLDEVLEWLDKAASLKPLVVGEAIIDEYVFCEGLGKSTKDPVLAVLQQGVEAYAGGSLAIANHLAGLCHDVRLVTQLGDRERREDFVREALRPNVEAVFLTKANTPTLCKRRIVDRYSGTKHLEIYVMDDHRTEGAESAALLAALEEGMAGRDLVVAADYGHGMLPPEAVDLLWGHAPFLALNVQSNAGNRGFNPISKYRRADYISLASHEVDMETRSREGDERHKMEEIARRVACPRFTMTLGKAGSLHYDVAKGFHAAPALATRVVDRVGAGDAVFALTSLLVRVGAPWEVVGFVGNAAGAQAVADLGNRSPVERASLTKHLTALLK